MNILVYPAPALSRATTRVADYKNTPAILDLLQKMMEDHQGVGLAANQIGHSERVCVVKREDESILRLVNPIFIPHPDSEKEDELEMCLSFPGLAVVVNRHTKIKLVTDEEDGSGTYSIFLEGFDARVAQHELEHLDGRHILYHLPTVKRDIVKRKYARMARQLKRFKR